MKKLLQKSLTKYFEQVDVCMNTYAAKHDEELLHQIRRAIKKIRTYANCFAYCDADFNKRKALRTYKQIYQFSQTIREQQVLLHLSELYKIKDYPVGVTSKKQWSNRRVIIEEWCQSLKKDNDVLKKACASVTRSDFNKYIKRSIKGLEKIAKNKFDNKQLHHFRKLLVQAETLLFIQNTDHALIPQFRKIEQLIGSWHDRMKLLEWVKDEHPLRKVLIQKLQSDNRADIRRIRLSIDKVFS